MGIYDICDECVDWLPGEFVFGDDMYVDEFYMDERWKYISDFPNYLVSDKGRLWSTITNRFIEGTPTGRCGHIDVSFKNKVRRDHRYTHRLVAEAFVPNPNNHTVVRHLDDDPSNNLSSNLEWGTQKDNMRDAIRNERFRFLTNSDRELAMQKRRMPVVAIRLVDGDTSEYKSQQEASRKLNISQRDISAVINGKRKSAKGYCFREGVK